MTDNLQPHISELRKELLATIREVRAGQMEPDRARAISAVAGELIDTARVEVEYMRLSGREHSQFIDQDPASTLSNTPPIVRQIKSGKVMHTMAGLVHSTDVDQERSA